MNKTRRRLLQGAAVLGVGATARADDDLREESPAQRARVEPHARRADPRVAVRRAIEVRGERQAPRKSRASRARRSRRSRSRRCRTCSASSRRPGLHFERHHAGHARHRPAPAPADDPRAGGAARASTRWTTCALPVGVAHPLHRVRREHRHGVGQRRGADGAVHARHALVQRVDRRAACRRCSTRSASTRKAAFLLAEGADGSSLTRTIPIAHARSTT